MIIRLVKLSFQTSSVPEFLEFFKTIEGKIQQFQGCSKLKLYQDLNNSDIFYTYSEWNSVEDLEFYRNSTFFKSTWAKTKILFIAPAEATTMAELVNKL